MAQKKAAPGGGTNGDLPDGLKETIAAFMKGCDAKHKSVSAEVEPRIIERFRDDYEEAAGEWPKVEQQVLTLARLAGRLAALYAERNGNEVVGWTEARYGLRDVKEECQTPSGLRGKHCMNVNLDPP